MSDKLLTLVFHQEYLDFLISQIVKELANPIKGRADKKVRSKQSSNNCLIMTSRVFEKTRRMYLEYGGAEEDRTPDLLRARQALSQLSYGPVASPTASSERRNQATR